MDSKINRIRVSCSIEWAWAHLGLPGRPGRTCKSPFREDKKPSFSVYMAKDGQRWYDQGEGVGGDVVDFFARAKDIPIQTAIDQLGILIGEAKPPAAKYVPVEEKKIEWPEDLRLPTVAECESLSMLRNLPAGAFDLAALLGFLKVGTHKEELLWFLTDASKKGAEGKTFTGDPCLASRKKTAALPGTSKSWCYGLKSDLKIFDGINKLILCEGTPDFFAALALLIQWEGKARPITMLGFSTNIGPECREYLRGKTVLIIPHNDPEGQSAAEKWKVQLRELGTDKRIIQPLPDGFKDLNEYLSSSPENPNHLLRGLA